MQEVFESFFQNCIDYLVIFIAMLIIYMIGLKNENKIKDGN
jgi:hypothetical protein